MKFAAEVGLKDHVEEATFAFVSGDEETVLGVIMLPSASWP